MPVVSGWPGERVGVTGPSGSGKSTLAALMLRFVDPDAGELRLGTRPMRALALDDVRRTVGLVDDDPHVFASTVVENVRLARPGAGDTEVEGALRKAHLGDWLDDLPQGLHTRLGDGDAQVSGGERARLAIARSLLAEHDVLVLDEPTAHLDTATAEALAGEVLQDVGRSILWITHEPTGLDRVDRVVELA
jgi:ATP-binding cassette, subfamily C, bacterial CydCD